MALAARYATRSALSSKSHVNCVTAFARHALPKPAIGCAPQKALVHSIQPRQQHSPQTNERLDKLWEASIDSVDVEPIVEHNPKGDGSKSDQSAKTSESSDSRKSASNESSSTSSSSTKSKMSLPKPNSDVPKHEMAYFKGLANTTRAFGDFRRVLFTGLYSQVVVMEVPVNGEIGDEVHTVDQILVITSGSGLATIAGKDQAINAGDVIVVPAGTQHQFVTKGDQPLELITVYSPAEHKPTTMHKDKEIGDKEEEDGIDEAPEWSQRSKKDNEKDGLVREDGKYD